MQGVSGSSPLAPTIFCSNVYAQLLLTFRLCVSIKTKYFVLIILILATHSQTPFLRQIRFVQSCIPSISHCTTLGEGGSSLFMFTITKQFDQRNNDKCQLAQIAKVQLELHKRHPSLRVGLRDFFIFKKCSLTRYTEVYLRAEPFTVMAAPEPHYRGSFLFYQKSSCLARFLFTQKKPAMLPVFRIRSILQNASSNL